jgi:hypothetical protein
MCKPPAPTNTQAAPKVCEPSYAFFVQDVGGWWTHKGIHVNKEVVIALISRFKHSRNVRGVLVVELPGGRKAYEWEEN